MLSLLTTSFRALVLYIRTAVGMHRYPPLPDDALTDFPPNDGSPISVVFWCQLLTRHCVAEPDSRKYEVVEIKRCKKNNGTQHEYLLALIRHPIHGATRRLRIERSRESVDEHGVPILLENQKLVLKDKTPEPSQTLKGERSDPQTPQPPRKLANGISQSSSKIGTAHDTVKFWDHNPLECLTSERDLETLDLSANPLPMYQLAILANTVHDRESLYNLFKAQCYWYTNMIARVIARRTPIDNTQEIGNPANDREHYYDPTDGKFWSIPVHTVRPRIVAAIEEDFKTRCALFEQEVRMSQHEGGQIGALKTENEALRAHIRRLESGYSGPSVLQ